MQVVQRKEKAGLGADPNELLKNVVVGRDSGELRQYKNSSSDEDDFLVSFKEFKEGGKLKISEQYEVIRSKSTQELEKIVDMSGGAFSKRSGGGRYDTLVDAIKQKRQERAAEMGKAEEERTQLEARERRVNTLLAEAQHQLHCLRKPWENDNIAHLHEEYQLAILVPRLKQDLHSLSPNLIDRLQCKSRFLNFFWYPAVRTEMLADPDVAQSITWVEYLRTMADVVPRPIISELFNTVVKPKLAQSPGQIRLWMPLIKLLDDRDTLTDYRRHLSKQFKSWSPDSDPKPILNQLKDARTCLGDPGQYNLLLQQAIAPILEEYLRRNLVIDARSQDLKPLELVMPWQKHLNLSRLLSSTLIPKLLKYLQQWLKGTDHTITEQRVVFSHIADWYLGWRKLMEGSVEEESFRPLLNAINEHLNNKGL